MPHFFISYAKKDTRELALQLEAALNTLPDVTAWVDKSLRAGRSWEIQIETEIRRCDYMIVLYSPDMNRHQHGEPESYVLSEIHYAKRTAHKPIIPIMAQKTDPPMSLTMEQYIDFTLPNLRLDDLIFAICDESGVGAHGNAPSSPAPTASKPIPSPRLEIPSLPPTPTEPDPGTRMTDDKGVEMIYVPAGKFLMGSNEQDDEKPIHEVQIAQPFWLDLIPVTNAAYAHFVKDGGYKNPNYWTKSGWDWLQTDKITAPEDYDNFTDPRQPRVGVSWYESFAYASWRGGRLPTEAEWEWAARGPEDRLYPIDVIFDANRLIYDENSGGKTAAVGSGIRLSGASWVGALDMSGNVWEWVNSLHQPYPYKAANGREDVEGFGGRVLRGGSWYDNQDDVRSSYRVFDSPFRRDFRFGFRLLRPPSNR